MKIKDVKLLTNTNIKDDDINKIDIGYRYQLFGENVEAVMIKNRFVIFLLLNGQGNKQYAATKGLRVTGRYVEADKYKYFSRLAEAIRFAKK